MIYTFTEREKTETGCRKEKSRGWWSWTEEFLHLRQKEGREGGWGEENLRQNPTLGWKKKQNKKRGGSLHARRRNAYQNLVRPRPANEEMRLREGKKENAERYGYSKGFSPLIFDKRKKGKEAQIAAFDPSPRQKKERGKQVSVAGEATGSSRVHFQKGGKTGGQALTWARAITNKVVGRGIKKRGKKEL